MPCYRRWLVSEVSFIRGFPLVLWGQTLLSRRFEESTRPVQSYSSCAYFVCLYIVLGLNVLSMHSTRVVTS